MAQETMYAAIPFIYKSSGLVARIVTDQAPELYYLNLLNCQERAEDSYSSRYGTIIINRDPNGTSNGQNYYFANPITSLARMVYQGTAWRYAGDSAGNLYRRTGNTQGPYANIYAGLSGLPFQVIDASSFQSSTPWLYIYDAAASIKDNGTGTPELTGIDPPPYTANMQPYAPLLTMIDNFAATNSYTTSGVSGWAWATVETLTASGAQQVVDFVDFTGVYTGSAGGYTPGTPGSTTTSAAQTSHGSTTVIGTPYSAFPSVAITPGQSVILNFTSYALLNVGPIGGPSAQSFIDISIDGGVTWTAYISHSAPPAYTYPSQIYAIAIYPTNLSLVQVRARAVASVSGFDLSDANVTVGLSAVTISTTDPGTVSFGPVVDGMISLLNTNTSINIPISTVESTALVDGIYTALLVTTAIAHGRSMGDAIAVYGAGSQYVNGYYYVVSVPSSTTLTVAFQSTVQLGSSGGTLVGGAAAPSACVLSNFYSTPYTPQMSAWGFYQQVPLATTSFPVSTWTGTVAQNSTGTITASAILDLSQNNAISDDDLFYITLAISDPNNISQITLQFNCVTNSGAASYYQKSISPAFYQAGVELTQDAYTTTEDQIFADTLGLLTGAPPGSTTAQLQPANFSSGGNTWIAIPLRRGDFLPVGQAGQAGYDWTSIQGYTLTITTNTNGSSSFSVNGLYLQWGYGPSSFAGIGYDVRYTYYNADTAAESNGSPEQQFNTQYGYLPSLTAPFLLRQALQVTGFFSPDPQVTHVRQYRRGGNYSANWFLYDQFPNITATGIGTNPFVFKGVAPDSAVSQAPPLKLDNDPPVTSSLPVPITTTLAAATLAPSGTSVFALFVPQVITVADASAQFVIDQIVLVGLPNTLEEVRVVAGGTGSFTAILRLQHNQGEPVYVYSVPRQPCNLCAWAYNKPWLAGDINNPHYLYYGNPSLPESFSPANYIPVGTPSYPIIAVINWRGTLFVQTTQTWYLIVNAATPYAQPTGSIHGGVANQGWTQVEAGIPYLAADGWRVFNGADGPYLSLNIEFIYRQIPDTPVPLADPTQSSQGVMCFYNNSAYLSYISLSNDGRRYRLIFDTQYKRFRNDDIAATAMLWEVDTNTFLVAREIVDGSGNYAICQDQVYSQDYDDGGWVSGTLVQTPIVMTIQRPYADLGKPHYPKQWNSLESDVDTAGQVLTTTLFFNTEPPTSIDLADATTTQREKVQLNINAGAGYQAYSMSLQHTLSVTTAPTLYQEDIYAAILADYRQSWDTYWIKGGSDRLKLVKQGYFDYTSTETITINLYADGSTIPYDTVTLPPQPDRLVVRRLFRCWKPRLWRMIATSEGDFQFWAAPMIELKPVQEGSTYIQMELQP